MYSCVSEGPCASPSATLTRLWAAVDHAINDRLPWTAQIKVPAISDGAALRRHGPGVHSPSRQLSSQPIMSTDMTESETSSTAETSGRHWAGTLFVWSVPHPSPATSELKNLANTRIPTEGDSAAVLGRRRVKPSGRPLPLGVGDQAPWWWEPHWWDSCGPGR